MSRLTSNVAIITGGTKGIGLGIAQSFIKEGAKVVLFSNDESSINDASKRLGSKNVKAIFGDITSESDVKKLIKSTVDFFGKIDILVNSAGIQKYGTVTTTSIETWDEVMNVNLKGIFLASKYAIPEMEKQSSGKIINISSVQSFASQANVAAYTASKGAILSLTRAMALDHADKNIRVNAICPSSVDTPMLRGAADLWKKIGQTADELVDIWGKAHPLGRVGKPEEIGAAAIFLASEDSSFMTGGDLKIDGGVLSKLAIILPE